MTKPNEPTATTEDGLVEHTEEKTPAEVRGFWTDERIAAAQPVPMPKPKTQSAADGGNETGEAASGERTP